MQILIQTFNKIIYIEESQQKVHSNLYKFYYNCSAKNKEKNNDESHPLFNDIYLGMSVRWKT